MKKEYLTPSTEEINMSMYGRILVLSDPESVGIQSLTEGDAYTGGWV